MTRGLHMIPNCFLPKVSSQSSKTKRRKIIMGKYFFKVIFLHIFQSKSKEYETASTIAPRWCLASTNKDIY